MDVDLTGKVVAVTGASSGIGQATALACAKAGAAVSLAARREDRIAELAGQINAGGGRAIAMRTDVGEEHEATEFIERTHADLGRLDVLVNNAGVMLLGPIEGAPTEEWRRMIHVNVFGVLYCTHAALGLMRAQGSGHIVNVSSVAGRFARAGRVSTTSPSSASGPSPRRCARRALRAGSGSPPSSRAPWRPSLPAHNRPHVLEQMAKRFAESSRSRRRTSRTRSSTRSASPRT